MKMFSFHNFTCTSAGFRVIFNEFSSTSNIIQHWKICFCYTCLQWNIQRMYLFMPWKYFGSSVELELNWIFSLINSSKIYCVLSSSIFILFIRYLTDWMERLKTFELSYKMSRIEHEMSVKSYWKLQVNK